MAKWCQSVDGKRVICADVVALDQILVYNRFGSFNPFGMMFALRRDVVPMNATAAAPTADECDELTGAEIPYAGALQAGSVRLKDCKRPRPMVLRANVGDRLHVRMTNLLRPVQPGLSRDFCKAANGASLFGRIWDAVSRGDGSRRAHGEAMCLTADADEDEEGEAEQDANWPKTRTLNFAVQGLTAVAGPQFAADGASGAAQLHPACKGLGVIGPDRTVDCYYDVDREGTYFLSSNAAPAGGEGDGGSITHGLFGAVIVEKGGTSWYRSQVSQAAFDQVFRAGEVAAVRHAIKQDLAQLGAGYVPFDQLVGDNPFVDERPGDPAVELGLAPASILNMLRRVDEPGQSAKNAFEIVHADLNAIINGAAADGPVNFREFSVFFHDELKSFYTRNFDELGRFGEGQLAGVRDGFAINYGASGMGAAMLANRKGIGPAANCPECLYEEFFLTSWANGDPALLEQFSDDPSNVHHSYLNDQIVFRNFHAGPKETHVFHLHAHQWFAGNDPNRGSYLDSQTVGPQQAFTYNIYGGGLTVFHKGGNGNKGWFESLGSGNRNRTIGDSIFHCHLYPHFAQGMWELWRVHDVLEDGTRKLPDGQKAAGLSLEEEVKADRDLSRPGSVDVSDGAWIKEDAGTPRHTLGTPIPALVPLPDHPLPLLPTYKGERTLADVRDETPAATPASGDLAPIPGYPFTIAGKPGHRPPQAPNDIARALKDGKVTDQFLDGGLPRHVVTDKGVRKPNIKLPAAVEEELAKPLDTNPDERRKREALQSQVVAKSLAMGDLTMHLEEAEILSLPHDGTELEKAGMALHHNGRVDGTGRELDLKTASGEAAQFAAEGGYRKAGTSDSIFAVNGAPPKPGAPFADPCGAPIGLSGAEVRSDKTYLVNVDGEERQLLVIKPDRYDDVDQPGYELQESDFQPLTNEGAYLNWITPPTAGDDVRGAFYKVTGSANGQQTVEFRKFAAGMKVVIRENDPFVDQPFASDPAVIGYRRYEGSAVQLDLVTNRAGWHDPQARINVLTSRSDRYKDGNEGNLGRISPRISASEEPFFFRALSGECIEYRHTNELPKELELDDFQVKTPTDTIGQHIHLVKFDVTSSDGSGNGFNYEDGTLAPDEIAARICAAKTENPANVAPRTPNRDPNRIVEYPGLCEIDPEHPKTADGKDHWVVAEQFKNKIWRLKLSHYRDLFQTTVQRWFADPILSNIRPKADGQEDIEVDRTLRTVFSHDHFGPSSIQQHGFYTALVIEPEGARICRADRASAGCTKQRNSRDLIDGGDIDVGTSRIINDPQRLDPQSRSFREFALAVADFATLYDPRDRQSAADLLKALETPPAGDVEAPHAKGIATLYCEAYHAAAAARAGGSGASADAALGRLKQACGSAVEKDATGWSSPGGNASPAWLAAGMPGDSPEHRKPAPTVAAAPDLFVDGDAEALKQHLVSYRRRAAGYSTLDPRGGLASPVAAPVRPESISVDHHDPYLLNYRGEPIPLRVGTDSRQSASCMLKPLAHWVSALSSGVEETCSVTRQWSGERGDMANLFLSRLHGDPVTPIMEAYSDDPILFRLIQGAQEVQHNFTLQDNNWARNIDQRFPAGGKPLLDANGDPTLRKACIDSRFSREGRVDQYHIWLRNRDSIAGGAGDVTLEGVVFTKEDRDYWRDYENFLANCFNADGRITAQEIGISEHFEVAGAYRNDTSGTEARVLRSGVDEVAGINNLTPSDTLQHFGSVDSQWNGAWSFLRVYKDRNARDGRQIGDCIRPTNANDANATAALVNCLAQRGKVGDRLIALDEPIIELDRAAGTGFEASSVGPPGVKVDALSCREDLPVVHATAVAIEPQDVFGDQNVAYGKTIYDRNGLFFALVDTRRIATADGSSSDDAFLSNPYQWHSDSGTAKGWIPFERVRRAIRDTYASPEPFVLTVNAGDCVKLTVINALRKHSGEHGLIGLVDADGDAVMPMITPLNTDRVWKLEGDEEASGPRTYAAGERFDLRPSAKLSLLLPLPTLSHQQLIARPFGFNATGGLAGMALGANPRLVMQTDSSPYMLWGERSVNIEQISFYAGRLGVPKDKARRSTDLIVGTLTGSQPLGEIQKLAKDEFTATVQQMIGAGSAGVRVQTINAPQPDQFVLAYQGQRFLLQIGGTEAAQFARENASSPTLRPEWESGVRTAFETFAARITAENAHFIPYAFGALPIASGGDIVSHRLHGLIGSINVLPQSADLSASRDVVPLPAEQRPDGSVAKAICDEARVPRACTIAFAARKPITPQPEAVRLPLWETAFSSKAPAASGQAGVTHTVREFTLFWQDGLNFRDTASKDRFASLPLVDDCGICDDSYDKGEEGVNYRSAPFNVRLRKGPAQWPESHSDLNAVTFDDEFFALDRNGPDTDRPQPHMLRAKEGEEIVVHIIHPGGRARQRAFVTIGQDYDDLFPGFGFPRAALVGPGKAVTASLTHAAKPGCYLWHDGPTHLRAGGVWGLLDVVPADKFGDPSYTNCARGAVDKPGQGASAGPAPAPTKG